jgi:polyisoprenoid-binding protein YceI
LKNSRIAVFLVGLTLFLLSADSRTLTQGQTTGGAQAPALRSGPPQGNGQTPGGPGRLGGAPAPDPTKPQSLTITDGTRARYKVQEQLAGISFPSEAVGTTESVTGTIIVNPDGSIAPQSKLVIDLRTITSDQSMRDGYVQGRTLETDKFPMLELVPKRAVGLPAPLPAGGQAQAGFQLVTDMTVHGVKKEVTWNVVATFANDMVSGRATTTVDFATFNMTKPSLARLLSVDDKIQLEIEFKSKRTGL